MTGCFYWAGTMEWESRESLHAMFVTQRAIASGHWSASRPPVFPSGTYCTVQEVLLLTKATNIFSGLFERSEPRHLPKVPRSRLCAFLSGLYSTVLDSYASIFVTEQPHLFCCVWADFVLRFGYMSTRQLDRSTIEQFRL